RHRHTSADLDGTTQRTGTASPAATTETTRNCYYCCLRHRRSPADSTGVPKPRCAWSETTAALGRRGVLGVAPVTRVAVTPITMVTVTVAAATITTTVAAAIAVAVAVA